MSLSPSIKSNMCMCLYMCALSLVVSVWVKSHIVCKSEGWTTLNNI